MKKYEPIEGTNKELKITVYYAKGGVNYFTGKAEKRGYWLSVTPVEIRQGVGYQSESYMAFSGYKQFLLEVGRQSNKAYNQAVELAKQFEGSMKERVIDEVLQGVK